MCCVHHSKDGADFFLARAPGLGLGDVIEITFDEDTMQPLLNTTELVLQLIEFNCSFGNDAYELSGAWASPRLLLVTVVLSSWNTFGVTSPEITAIGSLAARIKAQGNLR